MLENIQAIYFIGLVICFIFNVVAVIVKDYHLYYNSTSKEFENAAIGQFFLINCICILIWPVFIICFLFNCHHHLYGAIKLRFDNLINMLFSKR